MNSTAEIVRQSMAGLGWYIRRLPDSAALAEWYGGALGLPLIRGRVPVWFFWSGSSLCFELKSDTAPAGERHTDPETAPMVPVISSHDPEETLARIKAWGGAVVTEFEEDFYVLDPDRQLIAIRSAARAPALEHPNPNVGASPLPNDLAGWTATICRVPDLAEGTRFFAEVLGFPRVASGADEAVFSIGGDVAPGARLELRAGGPALPAPRTREERTDAIIFRVDDHDAVNAALKAGGLTMVNDSIRFNSASLSYALSPSGLLLGFEERFEPADFKQPRREFLEDREAIRRRRGAKGKTKT